MLCRHCGKKIPLLKRLTEAEFCSDAHRRAFMRMEEDAAISRLMQHGSKLSNPAESPVKQGPKAKGASKKQPGRDEIPAPLAGLVAELTSRPKIRRKALNRPQVLDWQLVRELPQSPLVIQARRMDVAGGIPIEAYPARGSHGSHEAALEALSAERLEEKAAEPFEVVEWAPLAPGQGPSPVAPAAGERAPDPGWHRAVAGLEFAHPGPGLSVAGLAGPGLAEAPAARAVEMARPAAEIQAGPWEAQVGRRAPKLAAGVQPHAGPGGEPGGPAARAAASAPVNGVEPEPCGLMALLVGLAGSEPRTFGRRLEWAAGDGSGLLAPRTSMAPAASLRPAGELPGVEGTAGAVVAAVRAGAQKALRPKRRLIGPRVARQGRLMPGVAGAGLVEPGAPQAAKGARALFAGEASLMAPAAGPMVPATGISGVQVQAGLAEPALEPLTGHRALKVSGMAAVLGAPAWPAADSLIPVAGLGVEEFMICTVGEATAVPDVQGPPLFDRLLPVFASRGLKGGREPLVEAGSCAVPSWALALSRQPAMRRSRLTVDHADGSGSRSAAAEMKPRRPWHSIQLPSFHLASWRSAPADLKWIMMALPMILLIALYSFLPPRTKNSVETASETASRPTVLSQRVEVIRTAIMERAAVKLADDFRSGLGAWQGQPGWAQSWTYNSSNYAVPGQLALYGPSLGLRDYVFSFLGQIDRRSINWVVRARDERNYLAMRIVMTRSGPLPAASLVRYEVVDGKPGSQTVLPLPLAFRDGMMQQVEVTVAGDTITTRVMGQIVDSFTENRLDAGGVGFFSPKGDRALLRWMLVTHQYDYIGRLCALLAPQTVMRQEARRME